MGFTLNTNINFMNIHNQSLQNGNTINDSLSALSSGLRINKSADDPSGMALASRFSAQSQGLEQAVKSLNNGVAITQIADGALGEYEDILRNVRVLSVSASSDTQDSDSRSYIQKEITSLMKEAEDIADLTSFNGIHLLNGSGGANSDGTFKIIRNENANTKDIVIGDLQTASIVTGAVDVSTQSDAEITIKSMDDALENISKIRQYLGNTQNSLESDIYKAVETRINVASAKSQLNDVDFASESANFSKQNILSQSSNYALSQANLSQKYVMKLLQ